MKKSIFFNLFMLICFVIQAQTQTLTHLDINPGNGNGIRFWSKDYYKISMGNTAEYRYGPVQDYSIKSNMYRSSSLQNRGWTWGSNGETPIAALRTDGTLQIANNFISEGRIGIGTDNPLTDLHFFGGNNNIRIKFEKFISYEGDRYIHQDILAGVNQGLAIRVGESPTPNTEAVMNTVAVFNELGLNLKYGLNVSGRDANMEVNPLEGFISFNSENFKLKPNGFLFARQIEVIGSGAFPDYVFDADYQLRPLGEVAEFIAEHHHLPEVPSAAEVEANGHNLRDMDEVLLKKVEELTLYLLEMKKENEALKQRVADLEEKGE